MAFFGATTPSSTDPKDSELADPPSDSISCLSFSTAPQSDYLAVGSWDNNVNTALFLSPIAHPLNYIANNPIVLLGQDI